MVTYSTNSREHERPVCCLVGNGPVEPSAAAFIDDADFVIRFNRCAGLHGVTGSRTDRLYLCNTGRTATRWTERDFANIILQPALDVVLSYPPVGWRRTAASLIMGKRGTSIDSSAEIAKMLRQFDIAPRRTDESAYAELRQTLVNTMRSFQTGQPHPLWLPSSGCVALHDTLRDPSLVDHDVHLIGFGFSGGKLHPWIAERAYAEGLRDCGKIHLHSTDGSSDKTFLRLPRDRFAL